jgi:hypothetical protein
MGPQQCISLETFSCSVVHLTVVGGRHLHISRDWNVLETVTDEFTRTGNVVRKIHQARNTPWYDTFGLLCGTRTQVRQLRGFELGQAGLSSQSSGRSTSGT